MRVSTALTVGCFLLAFGVGWYVFTTWIVPIEVVGWIWIIAGAGIIVSTVVTWKRPQLPIKGLVAGVLGGLILSLVITSGFGGIFGGVGPYRAEATKVYSGLVTANNIYVEVDNFNGPIRVSTWDDAAYKLNVTIVAKGVSQQNAEDKLADLKILMDDQVVQGQQTLTLTYDVPFSAHSTYAIEVDLVLPADAILDLDLDSSNGGIYLTDTMCNSVKMETSNGPLALDNVSADHITGGTSNGGIEGTVEAPETALSTSNGGIRLTLPCSMSGQYDLTTSNGNVKLMVSSASQVGYDVDLVTSNGDITIPLPDLEYSENQKTRKKARTDDFSIKAIQIVVDASTSNGNIDVEPP